MAEDESLQEHRWPFAPLLIFFVVIFFQFASAWLKHLKKKASKSSRETQLGAEIKQLLREANTLSQPSTFAQSAKLKRLAAAKEKELSNYKEVQSKQIRFSYELYLKVIYISKIASYLLLICWFWRTPVAVVSQQLVQPFGKLLSWRGGSYSDDTVMVGIIPWLILSTRVSRFIGRLINWE